MTETHSIHHPAWFPNIFRFKKMAEKFPTKETEDINDSPVRSLALPSLWPNTIEQDLAGGQGTL